MKALGWWLMLVGSLRLASVWFGFFNIWALRLAVFSTTTMTEVHGRTFGVWTLLTCTLCYLCAFNLNNKPLYIATFLSFIYAFGHFLSEYLIYHTMALANLTTVGIFAGTSIIWMLLEWNSHMPRTTSKLEKAQSLVLSAASMAVAALIEVKRKNVARSHNMLDAIPILQPPLPISALWLSLQYSIFGVADMFTYVGLLEFFYSESPAALKSISTCFLWSSVALGYFFSTILVSLVNRATRDVTRSGGWLAGNNINRNHLNLFYWLLSILSVINFLNYLFWSKWYKYRPQLPIVVPSKVPLN